MKKRKRKMCSILNQCLMKKWSKMEPKWSQKRTKMEPKWYTGATRTRHSAPGTSKSVPRPVRDRFWTTFSSDFDGFLMDFTEDQLGAASLQISWQTHWTETPPALPPACASPFLGHRAVMATAIWIRAVPRRGANARVRPAAFT